MPRAARAIALAATLACALLALLALPALAATAWHVDSNTNSNAAPGGEISYHLQLTNYGDTEADGTAGDPIRFTAALPADLSVDNVGLFITDFGSFDWSTLGWSCTGDGLGAPPNVVGAHNLRCTIPDRIAARTINLASGFPAQPVITVDVAGGATGTLTSDFTLSGAGAARSAATAEATRITADAPSFGVDSFDAEVTADASGAPLTQAGGHPYAASTTIDFNTTTNPNPLIGPLWPVAPAKEVVVDLPPGFVVDPTGAAQCTIGDLTSSKEAGFDPLCAPASQIGTTFVRVNGLGASNFLGPLPVFNVVPPPDAPASLGFNVSGTVITLAGGLRSDGDYGLTARLENIPEGIAFTGTTLTLWGVPADDAHTPERACPAVEAPQHISPGGRSCASGATRVALLRNPTACTPAGVGLETTVRTASWKEPDRFVTASLRSHLPPGYPRDVSQWGAETGPTGCDRVPFDPTFRTTLGEPASAGAPGQFSFDLSIPQTDDPGLIGQSDLKKAVVTLPQGVRVSPSSAQGLGACSPAQIGLDSLEDPTCPGASKIGELTLETPLLEQTLTGAIYLGVPFDNPFGSLLSLYIVARGPGVIIKLPGKVDADPATGQLTATFDDNPQLPFSRLHLEFNDGPRSPLVAPKACGTYTTHAELTGWSGRTVASDSRFTLTANARGEPCPATFTPGFEAGTRSNSAGRSSSFLLRMTRDDEDQELRSLSLDLPPGLTGKIASAVLCPEGPAAAGTCPEGSKVGDVTVGAGAGTDPFFITDGRAYLTGPYRGAPFGMAIVVPAVAGPFDLGNVVVRSALFVDKHTAEVRVVTDAFPTILEGIPLDVRDVRVDVNRPGFFLNPTSCAEKTIRGVVESTEGTTANVSSRFQAAECASLPLRPQMVLRVGGRRRTQRGRTTPFTATLRQLPGQANLRSVRVTLPTTINARLTVINDACTRAEYEAGNCEDARTGDATAVTPLLRDPLRGGVYFVRNGNPLPDLFVRLRGQVDFDLIGRITIPGSKRLRTTFDLVPDVPVSSFTLRLRGGRDGSIGNAANLCSRRGRSARAELDFIGQNGKVLQIDRRLKVKGCRGRASARGRRARRSRSGGRR